MITTNQSNPKINKKPQKLNRVTTKSVDASIKTDEPKKPVKGQTLSTNQTGDPSNVGDKLKRLEVIKQKKEYRKKKERMAKARAAKKAKSNKDKKK